MSASTKNAGNAIFLGFIIASLILSAAILHIWDHGPTIWGMSAVAFSNYVTAVALGIIAFVNYLKK